MEIILERDNMRRALKRFGQIRVHQVSTTGASLEKSHKMIFQDLTPLSLLTVIKSLTNKQTRTSQSCAARSSLRNFATPVI